MSESEAAFDSLRGAFHAIHGWYFDRGTDGEVRVTHAPPDAPTELDAEVTLDAGTWASVVAWVSAQGVSAGRHQAALDFHQRPTDHWPRAAKDPL